MSTVGTLLRAKGSDVWFVTPDTLVYEALQLMADKHIGAVPVMSGDHLEGIFSERDYARKVVLKGKSSKSSPVRDMMTRRVFFVAPDDNIETCMSLMTEQKVRHLPVAEEGKIVGIVTIGDVVKKIISEQEFTIQELEKYIMGG
jgi:CBS domain-containing protein